MNKTRLGGVLIHDACNVGVRSDFFVVKRWLLPQSKEVGLVVWVDGRPARGARTFLIVNELASARRPRQAIPDSIPFCPCRKWLNQNEFRP